MSDRSYLNTGRMNQKRRTRELLLEVAADLIRRNKTVSINDVADIAKVGRTTAYRYFPTADLLVANAALWKVAAQDYNEFLDRFEAGSTPFETLDTLVTQLDRLTDEHKNEFRAMLRVSLEQGQNEHRTRIRYFALKKALGGLQHSLGSAKLERLVCAICLTVGIESQIVLQDLCLLPADKAREVKRWAATSLLRAALAEARAENGRAKGTKPRTSRKHTSR
jgi:AcrR family transcriptional regulator